MAMLPKHGNSGLWRSRSVRDRYKKLLQVYRELSSETGSTLTTQKILKGLAELKKHEVIVKRNLYDNSLSLDKYIVYELTSFLEEDLFKVLIGHLKKRKVRRCKCAFCAELTYKMFRVHQYLPKKKEAALITLCPHCYLGYFVKH